MKLEIYTDYNVAVQDYRSKVIVDPNIIWEVGGSGVSDPIELTETNLNSLTSEGVYYCTTLTTGVNYRDVGPTKYLLSTLQDYNDAITDLSRVRIVVRKMDNSDYVTQTIYADNGYFENYFLTRNQTGASTFTFFISSENKLNKSILEGGTTGQVLKKSSDDDLDIEWDDESVDFLDSPDVDTTDLADTRIPYYDATSETIKFKDESGGTTTPLDYTIEEEGNDLAYISIGEATLAVGSSFTLDNILTDKMIKFGNKIKLKKGHKYKLSATNRITFPNNTSFLITSFYDETNGVYIDFEYPYDWGGGVWALLASVTNAANVSVNSVTTAVLIPPSNMYVSLKLKSQTGTVSNYDYQGQYSNLIVEELGIVEIPVLVNIPTELTGHSQGAAYTTDYPTVFWMNTATSILKIDIATGVVLETYNHASHLGSITYHNGKLYTSFTAYSDFGLSYPTSTIIELDPTDTTLIREVTNVGMNAFGAIGSNGTDLYVGYGAPSLNDGNVQKINSTTLLLEGSVINIPNDDDEFTTGIQTLNYFDGQWNICGHIGSVAPGLGGSLVITNDSFVVQNIYKTYGDANDGQGGNGLIQYKGNRYYCQPIEPQAPFTHRLRLVEID